MDLRERKECCFCFTSHNIMTTIRNKDDRKKKRHANVKRILLDFSFTRQKAKEMEERADDCFDVVFGRRRKQVKVNIIHVLFSFLFFENPINERVIIIITLTLCTKGKKQDMLDTKIYNYTSHFYCTPTPPNKSCAGK